ncbi:MAG: Sporulation protein YtfJ [ANME-2 cluster archaeon HR1]|jgi:sporulation protein YtfJ|nr:MAG: Sporulation protein YtfJ [ANME-2 cluster archaeon HR1]
MAAEDLIKVITEEIAEMISTKTVVGEYITVEGTTIIPVTKVTFGFGSGAGESGSEETNKGIGGGGGGGASVLPIAFLVVTPGDVKLLTMKEKGVVTQIAEIMPEILETSKSVIEAATTRRKKESSESIEESGSDTYTDTDTE